MAEANLEIEGGNLLIEGGEITQPSPVAQANEELLSAYIEQARSQPGVVPELIAGGDLASVNAAIVTAREVYNREHTGVGHTSVGHATGTGGARLDGIGAAGGGARQVGPVVPADASPYDKILFGVANEGKQSR